MLIAVTQLNQDIEAVSQKPRKLSVKPSPRDSPLLSDDYSIQTF